MPFGRATDFSELFSETSTTFCGRERILREIDEFVRDQTRGRVFLIVGPPGTGKTALVARATQRTGAAHFFCGRTAALDVKRGGGWSEPIRLAETLGTHLVRRFGEGIFDWERWGISARVTVGAVAGSVVGARMDEFRVGPRRPGDIAVDAVVEASIVEQTGRVAAVLIENLTVDAKFALEELFLGPLRRAAASRPDVPVVVAIDALDEWDHVACDVDPLELVMQAGLPSNVRLVVSSRPRQLSESYGEGAVVCDLSGSGVASDNVQHDVATFVEASLRQRGIEASPTYVDDLVRAADGNFLFVRYALDALGHGRVGEIPAGLTETYATFVHKLSRKMERLGHVAAMTPFLTALSAAREPMGLRDLARASGLPADATLDLINRCAAFLRRRGSGDEASWSPYHRSFAEFVLRDRAVSEAAHLRTLKTLSPDDASWQDLGAWSAAGHYALRHAVRHAILSGQNAGAEVQRLLGSAAYLCAKAQRLGFEDVQGDLVIGRSLGCKLGGLESAIAELASRGPLLESFQVDLGDQFATTLSALGDDARAATFAALRSGRGRHGLRAAWSSRSEGTTCGGAVFTTGHRVKAAAVAGSPPRILVADEDGVGCWSWEERRTIWRADVKASVVAPTADGSQAWIYGRANDGGDAFIRRVDLGSGDVKLEVSTDRHVRALATSQDRRFLAVGTDEGRVMLLDADTGATLARRETGHPVVRVQFDGEALAALTTNRKVVTWDSPRLTPCSVVQLVEESPRNRWSGRSDGLAFDARSNEAVLGCVDGFVRLVRLSGEGEGWRETELGGWVDHLSFLDPDQLVAGTSEGRLHVLSRSTGEAVARIAAHVDEVVAVGHGPEAGEIVSVSGGGEVRSWRLDEVVRDQRPMGHDGPVIAVGFANDGSILSLGRDGAVVAWSAEGRARTRAWIEMDLVHGLDLVPDLASVVVRFGGGVRRAELSPSEPLLSASRWPSSRKDKCTALLAPGLVPFQASQDGSVAACAGEEGAEVWDVDAGKRRAILGRQRCGFFLALDGLVMAVEDEGEWTIHDLVDPEGRKTLAKGTRVLSPPSSVTEGRRLVADIGDEIVILDCDSVSSVARWCWLGERPVGAVLSQCGRLAVTYGQSGTVELRDVATGRRRASVVMRRPVSAISLRPDGSSIVVGDQAGCLHVMQH